MCLVFLDYKPNEHVIIGANREENSRRPMEGPTTFRNSLNIMVFGQDRGFDGDHKTSGTWGGMNESGLIALITNRDDYEDNNQINSSRGLLCANILSLSYGATHAVSFVVKETLSKNFRNFNVILVDKNEAYVVHVKSPNLEIVRLFDGFHIITNLDVNDESDSRIKYVKQKHASLNILYDNNIVIHDDTWGTICSSYLFLQKGNSNYFLHSAKKPIDQDSYIDYSHLSRSCFFWR